MGRKIFIGLWMIVWPIIALFPALLSGKGPAQQSPISATQRTPVVVSDIDVIEPKKTPASSAPTTTQILPDAPQFDRPQFDRPQLATPKALRGRSATQPVSQATASLRETSRPATETASNEQLPPTADQPDLDVVSSVPPPRSSRRISTEITDQEEHARKLIHARALLRAQERHARLEVKYRHSSGIKAPTPIARWQQQLSQQNWTARTRASSKP